MKRIFSSLFSTAFFLLLFTPGNRTAAQCVGISLPDTLHACPNTTIAIPTTLTGTPAFIMLDTIWTPAAGLSNPAAIDPLASVGAAGTLYTLQIAALSNTNLVLNGDFSSGASGFSSGYIPGTGGSWGLLSYEGTYAITTSPNLVHTNFAAFGDHTSGTGQMLVVNGAATPNTSVWCQTINVNPNTDYDFSSWMTSCVSSNPAILQFSINNVLLGSPFNLSGITGSWEQFHAVWNSGSNTTATICITNQNTSPSGNDFAIDDIAFREYCTSTKSVYVAVANLNYDIIPVQLPCDNGRIAFQAQDLGSVSAPASIFWHFGDGHTAYGASIDHNYSAEGTYTVTLFLEDAYGCKDTVIKDVTVNNFVTPITVSKDTAVCKGTSVALNTTEGVSYIWSPATGLDDPSSRTPIATPEVTTTYQVTVTFNGCSGTASTTMTVYPTPPVEISEPAYPISCRNPSIQLQASGAMSYEWTPASMCDEALSQAPIVTTDRDTWFVVTGTDANHCKAIDSVLVQVDFESYVFVPSAFTPNGDGRNDVIRPVPACGFRVLYWEIYNRWGEKVFQSWNSTGWNGSYKGLPADIGTYFYFLKGETRDGKHSELKGEISLIK